MASLCIIFLMYILRHWIFLWYSQENLDFVEKKTKYGRYIYMWEWSAIGYYLCQIHDKITFIFFNIYNHFPSMSLTVSRLYYSKLVYQQSKRPSIITMISIKLFSRNLFWYNTLIASFYNVFMKKHDKAPWFKFDCSFLNWSKSFQYFFLKKSLVIRVHDHIL
jgi:hypothetical protein